MNCHEKNLDSIAKGMSELATSSRMPSSSGMADGLMISMVSTPETLQETVADCDSEIIRFQPRQ